MPTERGIKTKHSDYTDIQDQWEKLRDIFGGQRDVKDAGTKYLPKLGGQTSEQYEAYKKRGTFFNVTGHTADAFEGLVFRKDPLMNLPDNLLELQNDLSLKDETAKGFGKRLVRETLRLGRAGILVDFPRVEDDGATTQAEAEQRGENPYLTLYKSEEIRNWHVQREGGNTELKALILNEQFENQDGYFGVDVEEQYRLLEIVGEDDDTAPTGVYRQQIWRKSKADDESGFFLHSEVIPRIGGEPLRQIPFTFCGKSNTTSELESPPLMDLAEVNLSHYRSQADLEHGGHFTALPTITVIGADADEVDITVGPEKANFLENPDADIKMLEYTGEGLKQLMEIIDRKEDMMADLGARMVMNQEAASDAMETVQLKQQGSNSVIANIADTCGMAYEQALRWMSRWKAGDRNREVDVSIEFNKDLLPQGITPKMFKQLLAALQQGKITKQTFFENLQDGEIIDQSEDFEEYDAKTQMDAEPDLSSIPSNRNV